MDLLGYTQSCRRKAFGVAGVVWRGICVNTISPGYIRTAINDAWFQTEALSF